MIDIDAVWMDALSIAGEALAKVQPTQARKDWLAYLAPEEAEPAGVYDPADITEEIAAAMLRVATRYVKRHSGPSDPSHHKGSKQHHLRLPEADQDDAVGRILAHILTRDYTHAGIGRGNHAKAFWQSCALHRRTSWTGPDAVAVKEARQRGYDLAEVHRKRGTQGGTAHTPEAIAIAKEEAEARGVYATAQQRRGQPRKPRRELGRNRVGYVDATTASEALTPAENAGRYDGPAATPQPMPYPVGSCCPLTAGRRDLLTLAD